MTENEYLEEKNIILNQIKDLNDRLKGLNSEYIENNSPFSIGELVSVIDINGTSERGIVSGYEVTYLNKVEPIVHKIKKDGSKSQHKVWIWHNSKIIKEE